MGEKRPNPSIRVGTVSVRMGKNEMRISFTQMRGGACGNALSPTVEKDTRRIALASGKKVLRKVDARNTRKSGIAAKARGEGATDTVGEKEIAFPKKRKKGAVARSACGDGGARRED